MNATPNLDDNTGTPRWVKAFGIVTIVLLLAFAFLHLAGRGLGDHRHLGGDGHASADGGP
jgi:hypothetical protein